LDSREFSSRTFENEDAQRVRDDRNGAHVRRDGFCRNAVDWQDTVRDVRKASSSAGGSFDVHPDGGG
jgi:hypothetical protein